MKALFVVVIILSMASAGWAEIPCCLSIEKECRKLARDEQGIYGQVFPSKLRSQYLEETAYQECLKERCLGCSIVGDASGATILLRQGVYRITTKTITKWTTTSRTYPEPCPPGCLVIHHPVCNQTGRKYEITYAVIIWRGKQMEFELERNLIAHGPLYRSVICEDSRWPMNSWFELK